MNLPQFVTQHGVKYFKAGELYTREEPPARLWGNIVPTLFVADVLREEFGPTGIHSGYRNLWHNKEVGGGKKSLHLVFNALDLEPSTGTPEDWSRFLKEAGYAVWGGLGRYASFVHVDTRKLVFRRPATTWEG